MIAFKPLKGLLTRNGTTKLLKAFAEDTFSVTEKLKFVLGKVENIVGKGENAGKPAFSPLPTMFSKGFFLRVVQSRNCVVKS